MLLILAVDILRMLLKGVYGGGLDVVIIIEVAMIAILREIILAEIRSISAFSLISYGVVFGISFFTWCMFRKTNKK